MLEAKASKTAAFMAAYRARATADEPALCNDRWAKHFAGEDGEALARRYDEVYAHMQLWTAVRTWWIDARLKNALGPPWNLAQIVLLGAGFDTRAARLAQPKVRFFEVDHPDTQREKLARIASLPSYPKDAAQHVQCDFEREDFLDRLSAEGFDFSLPALFIWEGVTPYLTESAVRATLRRIADGTHEASAVIFDHLRKKIVQGDVNDERDKQSNAFVAELGEPLRWGSDDVLPLLVSEGFRRVRTTSFDEACLELTGTYDRERKFRFQNLVIASRMRQTLP